MARRRRDHTLQATALVGETFLKLERSQWEANDFAHVLALCACVMRQIIDYDRRRMAEKRGGGGGRGSLEGIAHGDADGAVEARRRLDLDAAITRLEAHDPEVASVVILFHFGGMRLDDIAIATGLSVRTVQRRLRYGRAWLQRDLGDDASEGDGTGVGALLLPPEPGGGGAAASPASS